MRWILTIIAIVVVMLGLGVGLFMATYKPIPQTASPQSTSNTPATKAVATAPVVAKPPTPRPQGGRIQQYGDLIHSLPGFAETTLAEDRLPFSRVARIHLPYYSYICPRGDLWIMHPEAPDLSFAMASVTKAQVHLSREQVVFVHWVRTGRRMEAWPVIRGNSGAFRLVAKDGTHNTKLSRFDYHWDAALSMDNVIVVPCDVGVAVIRVDESITEQYREMSTQDAARPQVGLTSAGFLAWIPTVSANGPKTTVLRYTDGKFVDGFNTGEWAGPFVHLVPFSDGSVLQIRAVSPGTVKLAIVPLETGNVDQAHVRQLVEQLSDEDPTLRDSAHERLAALGPAAWSLLGKLSTNQPPEAQYRIQQILKSRTEPTLGRFRIMDDHLQPVWRLRDGGVVFLAESGVLPAGETEQQPVIPGWLYVRPGLPISLIPPALAKNLAVGTVDLQSIGDNDWIVSDDIDGAQLFFGQELQHLTEAKDYPYRKVAGADRAGRILLRKPDALPYGKDFLLIDPVVADPTPVLQLWVMNVGEGEVGWDTGNWPTVKRGQAWVLQQERWEPLKGELQTTPPAQPSRTEGQTVLSQVGKLKDGLTIWAGGTTLALQKPDTTLIRQPLPAEIGTADAAIVCHDRLYVFNRTGQLARLRVDPTQPQPFTVEILFAENVPSIAAIRRMWLDPAGRICLASEDSQLIIFYADEQIPPAMLDLIPTNELKQAKPKSDQ